MRSTQAIKAKDGTELTILSKQMARGTQDMFDAILTIEDPNEPDPFRVHKYLDVDQEILTFHDIEMARNKSEKAFDIEDLQKAIAFIDKHRGEKIAIHCHAGISRSSAITILLLIHINESFQKSDIKKDMDEVFKNFPIIDPNKRIIEMGDFHGLKRDAIICEVFYEREKPKPVSKHNVW